MVKFADLQIGCVVRDLKLILFSRESIIVSVVALVTAVVSMCLSKYQRDNFTTNPFFGYIVWLMITRFGDCVLVYYPWVMCRPDLFDSRLKKKIGICLTISIILFEFTFLGAPSNKDLWETPSETTLSFKILIVIHFLWYFSVLFILPYYFASQKKKSKGKAVAPAKKLDYAEDVAAEDCWSVANNVGSITAIYSGVAITVPYLSNISLFKLGPVAFIPIVILLAIDAKKKIAVHKGYCLLFTIFQLGIHVLPTFLQSTLFNNNNGSSSNVVSNLLYYIIMTAYGHLWRLIAFNATSSTDHVVLLLLFQIFDVFFSNMVFIGVQEFNIIYGILVMMTFGRIILRESKFPNDLVALMKKTKEDPKELGTLQCIRIMRAKQSILLEVLSSVMIPAIYAVDSYSNWNIIVRKENRFKSRIFLLKSSMILLLTRLSAGFLAWIYLKYKSRSILEEIPSDFSQQQKTILPSTGNKDKQPNHDYEFSHEMLQKEMFPQFLRNYWQQHFYYVLLCVSYGIFNTIIFIGLINGKMEA